MQEQSAQADRDEARERRPEDTAVEGQRDSSYLAADTSLGREAADSAPASPGAAAAGEDTAMAASSSPADGGAEQDEAVRDAEEGAARFSPTEFMSPPTHDEAVHPSSPDWEVSPEQPADTSGTSAQETGPDTAPPATVDDAAHRGFLSNWSQAIRGEETPQQLPDEARLSSSSHYEAQQVAMPTGEAVTLHHPPTDEVPAQEPAAPEPVQLAETAAASLPPGVLVGDDAAVSPAAPVADARATEMATIEPRSALGEDSGDGGPAATAATAIPVAESAPVPAQQTAPPGAEGAEDAAVAAAPAAAAVPRVAPLPQKSLSDLAEGQVVTGRVKNLAAFGAFVDLGLRERKDGLIHVSQLADRRVGHPSEVVQIGQEVRVRVLGIDHDKGRISLSLRGADEPAEAPTSYRTAPVAEPEPPQGEATLESLMVRFGRPQAQPSAAPQRDTRRAERERREREEILRRMRGE